MRLNKLTAIVTLVLLVGMVAWGCWNWVGPKKATPAVDLPVGDDMATQIRKGTTIYTKNVPDFALRRTGASTQDFSATIKVVAILNTRTVVVEILAPAETRQQLGDIAYLYLCTPLSEKAEKLAEGVIAYGGNGYPNIIAGHLYDVKGVLQPGWQVYPLVYIPGEVEFQQSPDDSVNNQMLLAAARSFAEQAVAAGNHHMTREPAITASKTQIQAGKVEALMTIEGMYVLNGGPVDLQPMIAGELQYLQNHGTPLSAATKAVENDIADRRGTIEHAMSVPSGVSYRIKVVGTVDAAGNIDAGSLHVYVDNRFNGENYISAASQVHNVGVNSAFGNDQVRQSIGQCGSVRCCRVA